MQGIDTEKIGIDKSPLDTLEPASELQETPSLSKTI